MPPFLPLPFDELSEADVREEVITQMLRELGYRSGSENNIVREQSLRYPRESLGRKNPRRDPLLRGKADYILEVRNLVRVEIEAKAPTASISVDDIEQAWSYANHPEVRAVYFALCNGREFHVYQTNHGPNAGAVLTLGYEDLNSSFPALAELIGPDALLRDFPRVSVDTGPPIGPGLRSVVRITSGVIQYDWNSFGIPSLNELRISILGGAVERDEDGNLVAFLRTVSGIRTFQEMNERLGLDSFEMVAHAGSLSSDPTSPTRFVYAKTITLPAGERLLDIARWNYVTLDRNLSISASAEAAGALSDRQFSGVFTAHMQFLGVAGDLRGPFDLHLA